MGSRWLVRLLLVVLVWPAGNAVISVPAFSGVVAAPRMTSDWLAVTPRVAIPGEYLAFRGRLPARQKTVQLQVAKGGRWTTLARNRTTDRGFFAFRLRSLATPGVSRVYRVRAPRQQGLASPATSPTRRVLTVAQRISLTAPAQVHVGLAFPVSTVARPIRPGRLMLVQIWQLGAWRTLGRARQDVVGAARVSVTSYRPGMTQLRAVAVAAAGAVASNSESEPVESSLATVVVTDQLPEATTGSTYSATLASATGVPGSWSVVSGTLPDGLALDPASGGISGTATTAGVSAFTVRLIEANGNYDDAVLTLVVLPAADPAAQGSHWSWLHTNGFTTCGADLAGQASCWGWNARGATGDGTTESPRLTPFQHSGIWADIAPDFTTCGVKADQTAWCWGDNYHGSVGDGSLVNRSTPYQLPGAWRMVGVGSVTCGIQTDDTGWCWGSNSLGLIGNGLGGYQGQQADAPTPTQLPGYWRALQLPHSDDMTLCGIQADDTGWCWGYNAHGQVGNGTKSVEQQQTTPYRVPGLWRVLTSRSEVTCGIQIDSTGWCWGSNGYGSVGNGQGGSDNADALTPSRLPGLWRTLGTSNGTTCGIQTDDTAWCWGLSDRGQTGNQTPSGLPQQLPGTWLSLVDSPGGRCGIRTDFTGWCWGRNEHGQVGNGYGTDWPRPAQLPGTWLSLSPRDGITCGIQLDQTGWCWGQRLYGAVGDGSANLTYDRPTPYMLPGLWRSLDGSPYLTVTCGLQLDSSAWCWGADDYAQLGDGAAGSGRRVGTPSRVT